MIAHVTACILVLELPLLELFLIIILTYYFDCSITFVLR